MDAPADRARTTPNTATAAPDDSAIILATPAGQPVRPCRHVETPPRTGQPGPSTARRSRQHEIVRAAAGVTGTAPAARLGCTAHQSVL